MNCWEFMKCLPETYKSCPAYPDMGRECWKTPGTKCDGGRIEMATLVEKVAYCRQCEFYIKYLRASCREVNKKDGLSKQAAG